MKNAILGFIAGLLSVSCLAFAAFSTDILTFAYGGIDRARMWVASNGRIGMQSHIDNDSTALDLWPTSGTIPGAHSLSEIVLQRLMWGGTGLERFNISAMTDVSKNGSYRFGVEKSGTGQFRDVIFCFEDVTPGIAYCPFKVTPAGAFASSDGGTTWRQL